MEALGDDLVGMKTKGLSLLGGSQDIWKERKGMRGGEGGEEDRGKGISLLSITEILLPKGGANEGLTETSEIFPHMAFPGICRRNPLPTPEIGSKYPQGSSPALNLVKATGGG